MTNEEAARVLKLKMEIHKQMFGKDVDEPLKTAYEMAIKALFTWPEIVRCKDCEYGRQDEEERWFCTSLGCQIGSEDGNGYCADAERRTDGQINQPQGGN